MIYFDSEEEKQKARAEQEKLFRSSNVVGTAYEDEGAYNKALDEFKGQFDPEDVDEQVAGWKKSNFIRQDGMTYHASESAFNEALTGALGTWEKGVKVGAPPTATTTTTTTAGTANGSGVPPVVQTPPFNAEDEGAKADLKERDANFGTSLQLYQQLLAKAKANGFKTNDFTYKGPMPAGAAARAKFLAERNAERFTSTEAEMLRALDKRHGDGSIANSMPLTMRERARQHGDTDFAVRSAKKTAENEKLRREIAAWGGVKEYNLARDLRNFRDQNRGVWDDVLKMVGGSDEQLAKMSAKDKLRVGKGIHDAINAMAWAQVDNGDDMGFISGARGFKKPGDYSVDDVRDAGEEFALSPEAKAAGLVRMVSDPLGGEDQDVAVPIDDYDERDTKAAQQALHAFRTRKRREFYKRRGSAEWFPSGSI